MSTPYNSRYVGGEGPVPCRIMLIGEGPGEDENRQGRPFVGKSGVELWRYLWRGCHLTRDDVYVTNLVKYHIPGNEDPTDEDIERDAGELSQELESVDPKFILCLGRYATRNYLGGVDMDAVHGVAHQHGTRIILPCIHPAAGLHNTEFQAKIAWDFDRAGDALRGRPNWAKSDGCKRPGYGEVVRPPEEGRSGTGNLAAVDTEGSMARPWCLSYSEELGVAYCIRRGHSEFGHIVLHNSLHDIGVLDALDVNYDSFDDTMVMAYELGIEPQGLKNLALRHCGMVMREYQEVLGDAQRHHNLNWLATFVKQWQSKQLNNGCSESGRIVTKNRKLISATAGKKSARTCRSKRRK